MIMPVTSVAFSKCKFIPHNAHACVLSLQVGLSSSLLPTSFGQAASAFT
jgi:hypothetical protein